MVSRAVYAEAPLRELLAECQRERSAYNASSADHSPACVELTRRALAGEDTAWSLFQQLFEPLMRAWIGMQQLVEPEDVLQEALFAFARWAPTHPELVSGTELGRALAFLRQCTKTALLTQVRKAKRPPYLPIDQAEIEAAGDHMAAAERRIVIHERAAQLLKTEQEWIVFRELLLEGRKPQEIYARHRTEYDSIEALRVAIQRVLRRLRNDTELSALW